MRKKLDLTEGIFPIPVLMVATYNEDGSVNIMNAAWAPCRNGAMWSLTFPKPIRP